MPLPMTLNHINLWLWKMAMAGLSRTGMKTTDIAAAWESLLSVPLAGRPVKRVICTHMHPDHVGMAGLADAPIPMPVLDDPIGVRNMQDARGRWVARRRMTRYGFTGPPDGNPPSFELYKARFGEFGKMIYSLPDSFH